MRDEVIYLAFKLAGSKPLYADEIQQALGLIASLDVMATLHRMEAEGLLRRHYMICGLVFAGYGFTLQGAQAAERLRLL